MLVDRDVVMSIPAPPRTKTWGVIPHGHVINAMDAGCRNVGLIPDGSGFHERYEVDKTGSKLFALWSFGDEGIVPSIGFRNSIDKTMTWGIAAGSYVYVCSNMQFAGDYLDFQKHIGSLTFDTAFDFAASVIAGVYARSKQLVDWSYKLREVEINNVTRKAYMYDQLANGVIKLKFLNKHMKCLSEERGVAVSKQYNPESLYVHHNATTRFLNRFNMSTVFDRTNTLKGITDDYLALAA